MIDVHAHLCFPDYGESADRIARECQRHMDAVIVTSARYDESVNALELCEKYSRLFPSIGCHPVEGDANPDRTIGLIRKSRDRIVGIGEVGLDYHWVKDSREREQQEVVFSDFIRLAVEMKKPLVIHSWDAEPECFRMVQDLDIPVIFHCYSGSRELAEKILKKGFYISFSTQVLFSKSHRKLAKLVPLEQMTLETDSPFLSPYGYLKAKGQETRLKPGFNPELNYPWNIKFSAEKIGELKGVEPEEVMWKTKDNAVKIFGLKL